jgi:hypothetical protein
MRAVRIRDVATREADDRPSMSLATGERAGHSDLAAERGIRAPLIGVQPRLGEQPDLGLDPAGALDRRPRLVARSVDRLRAEL